MYRFFLACATMSASIMIVSDEACTPIYVEQSATKSHSELNFDFPEDLNKVFSELGKPSDFDLQLAYHCYRANTGYVQLSGHYSKDTNFEAKVQNRKESHGELSSMFYGEVVFGTEKKLKLPFVISAAKIGVLQNQHDKIEGHIVWLELCND